MTPRHLIDNRARFVTAHRLAASFAPWLSQMASLFDALGRDLGDARWHAVASKLDQAAVGLRELL